MAQQEDLELSETVSSEEKRGIFGTNTASANLFAGQLNQTASLFGGPQNQTPSLFGGQHNQTPVVFGGQQNQTTAVFGGQQNQTTAVFGGHSNETSPVFGRKSNLTSNLFGGQSSQSSTVFGGQSSQSSTVFGGQSSQTSVFRGQSNQTSTVFGGQSNPTPNLFGGLSNQTSNVFGAFSGQTGHPSPILGPSGEATSFGSAGTIRSGVKETGTSVFGGSSVFGSKTQPSADLSASNFGKTNTLGTIGGQAISGSNTTVKTSHVFGVSGPASSNPFQVKEPSVLFGSNSQPPLGGSPAPLVLVLPTTAQPSIVQPGNQTQPRSDETETSVNHPSVPSSFSNQSSKIFGSLPVSTLPEAVKNTSILGNTESSPIGVRKRKSSELMNNGNTLTEKKDSHAPNIFESGSAMTASDSQSVIKQSPPSYASSVFGGTLFSTTQGRSAMASGPNSISLQQSGSKGLFGQAQLKMDLSGKATMQLGKSIPDTDKTVLFGKQPASDKQNLFEKHSESDKPSLLVKHSESDKQSLFGKHSNSNKPKGSELQHGAKLQMHHTDNDGKSTFLLPESTSHSSSNKLSGNHAVVLDPTFPQGGSVSPKPIDKSGVQADSLFGKPFSPISSLDKGTFSGSRGLFGKNQVSLSSVNSSPHKSLSKWRSGKSVLQPDRKRRESLSAESFSESKKHKGLEGETDASLLARSSSARMSAEVPSVKNAIIVKDIPPHLNKVPILRKHFSHFGNITRIQPLVAKMAANIIFKTHEEALAAKTKGKHFVPGSPPLPIFWRTGSRRKSDDKQPQDKKKTPVPGSVEDELASMAELADFEVDKLPSAPVQLSLPKSEAVRQRSPTPPPVAVPGPQVLDVDTVRGLIKSINRARAKETSERIAILESRDKILKILRGRQQSDLATAKAFEGTCPDMCPEKERYYREDIRRLSVYEVLPGTLTSTTGLKSKVDHLRAVKEYSRSSADQEEPLPHELRPLPVLVTTMNYLLTEVADTGDEGKWAEWYDFLWNRTRGIRKGDSATEARNQRLSSHQFCSAGL